MPKPSLTTSTSVTTVAEVELKPALRKKLDLLLKKYQTRHAEIEALEALQDEAKDEMELAFAESDQYEALQNGVRVNDIPLKIVEGKAKKTDYPGIMKRWKITPKDWAKFVTEKPKKAYLSISLPRKKKDTDED